MQTGQQVHILIVDDDTEIRGTLKRILSYAGYEVDDAEDGLEAFEKIQTARPNLILLDLMMPRMDGYTFARKLEDQDLHPPIPFIVLSAYLPSKTEGSLKRACAHIAKPFDLDQLLDAVATCAHTTPSA